MADFHSAVFFFFGRFGSVGTIGVVMSSQAKRARAFRLRAEEVRSIADDMKLQKTRDMLEDMASDFDRLAEALERESQADARSAASEESSSATA